MLFPMNRTNLRAGIVTAVLALALAGTACAPARVAGGSNPSGPNNSSGSSRAVAPSTARRTAPAPILIADEQVDPAIQSVVERGNAQQVQAITSHDATLMRDTSTDRYYQELAKTNEDLLNHGVV